MVKKKKDKDVILDTKDPKAVQKEVANYEQTHPQFYSKNAPKPSATIKKDKKKESMKSFVGRRNRAEGKGR